MRKLRRTVTTVATLSAALGLTALATGTAQASTLTNYWTVGSSYQLQSWYNANCLDDSGQYGLRDFTCYQNSYNGGWQKWTVIAEDSNGYAQLQDQSTGNCLDWSPQYGLRTFPCYANSFNGGWQKWQIVTRVTASGYYEQVLKNGYQANGNYCLDDSQYGVRGFACNGSSQDAGYQGWDVWVGGM